MADETPILPAHIEDTLQAIAKLHADHRQEAGKLQRVVEQLTALIGRPRFIASLTVLVALWIGANLTLLAFVAKPWDPPPFNWLQGGLTLLALYVTVLILATQRREDQLAGYREQLTLELAIWENKRQRRSSHSWKKCVVIPPRCTTASTRKRQRWLFQPIHRLFWTRSRKVMTACMHRSVGDSRRRLGYSQPRAIS